MNEQALNISTGRKYWIDVLRALGGTIKYFV